MSEKYTTHRIIKKFKLILYCGISLICIAIIQFLLNSSDIDNYQSLGKIIDMLILLCGGLYSILIATKRIKQIKDNFFEIDTDSIIICMDNKTIKFDYQNKPKSIIIKLKTIEIESQHGLVQIIKLGEYSLDMKTRKKIKEKINELNKKFKE